MNPASVHAAFLRSGSIPRAPTIPGFLSSRRKLWQRGALTPALNEGQQQGVGRWPPRPPVVVDADSAVPRKTARAPCAHGPQACMPLSERLRPLSSLPARARANATSMISQFQRNKIISIGAGYCLRARFTTREKILISDPYFCSSLVHKAQASITE